MKSTPRSHAEVIRCALIICAAASGAVAEPVYMHAFAGGGASYGEGVPATQAQLAAPQGIAFDADGNACFADADNFVVRRARLAASSSAFPNDRCRFNVPGIARCRNVLLQIDLSRCSLLSRSTTSGDLFIVFVGLHNRSLFGGTP